MLLAHHRALLPPYAVTKVSRCFGCSLVRPFLFGTARQKKPAAFKVRWTVRTPHFNLSSLMMRLLVQKRLALQVFTNPTMLFWCSGVKG